MAGETTNIPVHVTPKANKNAVAGVKADADGREEVQVRVTVAPEGGKANKAVCETLAKALGVPKSHVRIARGETSRHKVVEVDGYADAVESWLAALRNA